jgi:hypothetical protein
VASAFRIIDHIIAQRQYVALSIQREMVDERRDVDDTAAGRYLRRKVIQEQDKVQQRLARSAQELDEKLEAQETAEVEEVLERQREYQQKLEEKAKSLAAMKLDMDKLREQKAQEFTEREKEFEREKAAQEAIKAELDGQIRNLQTQRDVAVKQAQADAEGRNKLENTNLRLLIQRDLAIIADIDRAISDRKREEERLQRESQQVFKQENIFKHTMKVSLAEMMVHGAVHAVKHVATTICTVM